jgi:hypothetical protein
LLAKVISDNYIQLRRATKKSKLSASPPVFDWSGPRAVLRPSIDLRDDFRIDLSSRREEFVSADIRAFFHSIYTHSIPWAIYGKKWAKVPSNRGTEHYGNLLDLFSRNLQDGQTVGLPVGPDTSRILAELIASSIDTQLQDSLGLSENDASRYIDDYTISSNDGRRGDAVISALRQSVAHFELELNNEKSAVIPTSARYETGWKEAIKAQIPSKASNAHDMNKFFYDIGQLCLRHPDINIEKFAYSSARLAFIRADDWRHIQSRIINAYRRNSTLVSFLVEILILRQVEKGDVDHKNVKDFLDHRIPNLVLSNKTGEIIWLLFLSIRLNISLSHKASSSLFEVQNALVALLTATAHSRKLLAAPVDFSVWNSSLNQQGLRGPMWLYSYEAIRQKLIQSPAPDFIQTDSFFSLLYSKNVQFLDINRGFSSIGSTLRTLRGDNSAIKRIRDDFSSDFSIDIDDYDDDDFTKDEDENYGLVNLDDY